MSKAAILIIVQCKSQVCENILEVAGLLTGCYHAKVVLGSQEKL